MDAKVKEQILAIRDSGLTNMFDIETVRMIAMGECYFALADYLLEHKREYSCFIMTGEEE